MVRFIRQRLHAHAMGRALATSNVSLQSGGPGPRTKGLVMDISDVGFIKVAFSTTYDLYVTVRPVFQAARESDPPCERPMCVSL